MSDESEWSDGRRAFPSGGGNGYEIQRGMSLRDWFAGQALAGILASELAVAEIMGGLLGNNLEQPTHAAVTARTAWVAYSFADAMLKERAP